MKSSKCCYGYARVSTAQQSLEGSSLTEQEKKVRAWADFNDKRFMGMYVDAGVSGTHMFKRPEFSKLLERLDRGDVLVANDISRVSRNYKDMVNLIEKLDQIGASVVFIKEGIDTSTSTGKIMTTMISLMKSMEVEYTSERVKETHQISRKEGRTIGPPPYGWKKISGAKGSGLEEVPEQQAIIALIRKLRDEEKMSFCAIANKLTKDEVPSPRKTESGWNDNTVRYIYNRKEVATKGRHNL